MIRNTTIGLAAVGMLIAVVIGSVLIRERQPESPASTALRPAPSAPANNLASEPEEQSDPVDEPIADKALFVDASTGEEGAEGTIDAPIRRPREAFERVEPGTTIYLRGGTYDDRETNNNILTRSGTPEGWIDIRPYPGEHVEIIAGGEWGNGFEFQGASYVRVSGFTIRGRTDSIHGSGVFSKEGGHHIEVLDNDIAGFGGAGVSLLQSSMTLVEGNTIRESASRSYFQGSGINLFEAEGPVASDGSASHIIRNNLVVGNYNGVNALDGQLTDGNCIIIDFFDEVGYSGTTLIENNVCVENGGRGVYVFNSSNVLARNNTMIGNVRSEGLNGGKGEMVAARSNNIAFHNNLVLNTEGIAGYIDTESNNVAFVNNYILNGDVPSGIGNQAILSTDPVLVSITGDVLEKHAPTPESELVGSADPGLQPDQDALGEARPKPGAVGAVEPR